MIEFSDVSFSYRKGEPVFSKLNLKLISGLTMILGPNGSGKSTLLKLAAGVEFPDEGKVFIGGRDVWKDEVEARRHLAYLPEYPDLTPYATIGEICDLVCRLRGEPLVKSKEALRLFSLDLLARRSVRELSLGQKKRATFAAAFIGRPEFVLLDEPLEAMDRTIQREVMDWILRLVGTGAVVAVVSHMIEPFADLAALALGLRDDRTMKYMTLPADRIEKIRILEQLARGLDSA
jgi:ABC-2 type transport system ATP-binding protein